MSTIFPNFRNTVKNYQSSMVWILAKLSQKSCQGYGNKRWKMIAASKNLLVE